MSKKQRVIFFAVTALQLLVAAVGSEEMTACDQLSRRRCDDITSEDIQRCIEERPQIDDVEVKYFGVEDIQKELEDGPEEQKLRSLYDEPAQQTLGDTSDLQNSAVCEWRYKNHFDRHRIPSNISHASCVSEETTYSDAHGTMYQCRPIWYPMNVLKWGCEDGAIENQIKWNFTNELVSFGCSLMRISRPPQDQ